MSEGEEPAGAAGTCGFDQAVRDVVAPMLAGFGLTVVGSGGDRVRFESDVVGAVVFHEDDPGAAIGFRFAGRAGPARGGWYSVSDAMRLADPAAAARYLDFSARTADQVRLGLERLRRDVERYCAPALSGDADVFSAMAHARELYFEQKFDWDARSRRMGLNAALDRRDWKRVIEIYESAEHDLPLYDSRRLHTAWQNLRTGRAAGPAVRADPQFMTETIRAYRSYRVFFSPTAEEDEYWRLELAVGDAMGAGDWERVIELYESSLVERDELQQTRLEIARRKLATTRELTPAEVGLLRFLLAGMCDDAAPLLAQLEGARAVTDDDAATWLQIEVRPDADPVELPNEPIPGRATVIGPDGSRRAELFVWVDDGNLTALQHESYTDETPTAMPDINTVSIVRSPPQPAHSPPPPPSRTSR